MKANSAAIAPSAAAPPIDDWHKTDPWIRRGMHAVVGLVGGLMLWMTLVSISGAVMAPGKVTVESSYQMVQHLDGGIVREIAVRNGDRVTAGDVVMRLDPTQAAANLGISRGRVRDLAIQSARLEAERDRSETFQLPDGLDMTDEETRRIYMSQKSLFDARSKSRLGEQSVLLERRRQVEEELRGAEAQLTSARKQLAINGRELASIRPLFDKGYVNQQRILPLEREAARLEGETGRMASEVSKVQGALMEIDLKLAQAEKAFTTEVVDELRKVQAQLAEARESEKAHGDRLARIDIRAPRTGRVHALAQNTVGGVITPASPIMQIIPDDERLIVTAEMKTQDIDKVRPGQLATIRFPAFDAATTPRLDATVIRVSPAEITDQQGRSFFTAEVEIKAEELAKLDAGHLLVPGMPAEVYFETGSRSILSYMLKPLTDAMAHAFRDG